MLWLGIHYPNWALQYMCYCQQQDYDLNERLEGSKTNNALMARALYDSTSLTILACDRACQQQGVAVGMSLAMAQALAPQIALWPYQEELSDLARDWLSQWSYDFSARLVPIECQLQSHQESRQQSLSNRQIVQPPLITDTLLLEVGSMLSFFGGLDKLIEGYRQAAKARGLSPQFAWADTGLAAQMLARYQAVKSLTGYQRSETLASHSSSCGELALDCLPIDPKLKSRLQAMGLRTIKELEHFSAAEMAKGELASLVPLMAHLDGRLPCVYEFYQPKQSFYQKQILNHDVEYIQGLVFPLSRLLKDLALFLRQHQLAVLELKIILSFRQQDLPEQILSIAYPFAEHQEAALLSLCRLQLEKTTLYQSVTEIGLSADNLIEQSQIDAKLRLGDENSGANSGNAKQLLANLLARLGADKLSWLGTGSNSHLPEEACRTHVVTQEPSTQQVELIHHSTGLRPSWLLPQPHVLQEAEVQILKGPERISGPWWHDETVERDYYIAQHLGMEPPTLCWVYKDSKGLWLQGWFS